MGSLDRRVGRLEEDAEGAKRAEQAEREIVLQEALTRISTEELEAMKEVLDRSEREEWEPEDEPLMRRLVEVMEEVRAERTGEFPWLAEMEETDRKEQSSDV